VNEGRYRHLRDFATGETSPAGQTDLQAGSRFVSISPKDDIKMNPREAASCRKGTSGVLEGSRVLARQPLDRIPPRHEKASIRAVRGQSKSFCDDGVQRHFEKMLDLHEAIVLTKKSTVRAVAQIDVEQLAGYTPGTRSDRKHATQFVSRIVEPGSEGSLAPNAKRTQPELGREMQTSSRDRPLLVTPNRRCGNRYPCLVHP
jgi:hypothetical protein